MSPFSRKLALFREQLLKKDFINFPTFGNSLINKDFDLEKIIGVTWGPLPVETRGTAPPPQFSFGGGQKWFWPPPPILEVYNNSNLVNNEVFKKLTTKLASMKYHITETLSDITC